MSNTNLMRLGGLSLFFAGIANVLFWLLVIPLGTFVGSAASLNPIWIPSQLIHTLAAMLALLGLVGLQVKLSDQGGRLGVTGFALSLFGTGFYLADAVIALVVFPIAAMAAPALIAADGALNLSLAYVVFAIIFMVGYILYGLALLRDKTLPRIAIVLLVLGAILANLPPGLVPMPILILGGVTWGIGAAWLGLSLQENND